MRGQKLEYSDIRLTPSSHFTVAKRLGYCAASGQLSVGTSPAWEH